MRLKNLSILVTLCLSVSGLVAQPKTDYDRKWKIIDSLYNKKGLTESALTEVNKLLLLSRQEHNQPQSIKALIYREVLNSKNENAEEATVKELDSAIVVAPQPARAVLENLLAGVYERYFLGHQWQLRNRSKTVNFVKADMGTWGADDFDSRIGGLYLASLQQQSLLASVKPADFNPILLKGNVPSLRPTLFDLLAHRALDYFTYNIAGTGAAADAFAIEDTVAFGDAAAFARHRWITTDTGSRQYRALTLFQRLIVFHLGDSRPAALIDVDLERLQFVNNNGAMDDKDGMFTHALIRITDKYGDEPAAAEAWYLQAKQYDNVKAKAICDRVIAQKDSSQGKEDCLRLRDELLQKYLTVQTEKINPPGMPMRALVTWSNIDHLYLRLINMDSYTKLPNINIGDPGFWKEIAGRPAYRRFDLALPDDHDYRRHSAEIAIGALPSGSYALLGTADPDSGPGKAVCVQYLYVSGIADFQKGSDYFVVDRNSGRPLGGATVQVWSPDQSTRQQLKKAELYHTDDKGHFILRNDAGKNAYREIALEISTGGDHLFVRDMYASNGPMYYDQAQSEPEKYEEEHQETYFFLDRKIYRPGQTVYFKGVVVTRDKTSHEPKMMAGRKTKVFLYDANSTVVDSLELTANDYGSYHGSFRLPTGRLNGSWRLSDAKNGEASFSVEEYKRPTFYVEYEKQKGGYRLGDSIRVTGNVKAYAGNGLDGASVTYRVIRRSMVRPLYSWGRIVPRGETKEIKHGVVKTDSKGNFSIVFVASPDRMIDRKTDPRWEFEVSADVTDINGETRSGRTSVTTGYTALNLDLRVAGGEHLPSDSLRQLTVGSANLSGEPVNSRVKVSIYPLRSPERLIRQRLWARPDRWLMTEKAFLDSFPHDEYKNELEKESWAKGSAVWEESGATGAASGARFSIPAGRLTPGWYFVEATTTDAYGQEVKDGSYIELYDGRTGKPANPQYSWLSVPEQTVEPGRKARVEVGSSAKEVVVFRHVEHIQQKDSAIGLFTLGGERKTTEFDISETDRGGISVSDVFVKDNRIYSVTHRINVPWTNKELAVRYASYRDKTEPGSKEKWSVTISGQHGDKVSAEVLAAMYDASLDQFESHQWAKPDLYPELSGDRWPWMSSNFVSGYSFMKWEDRGVRPPYIKVYDRLMSGDDNPLGNYYSPSMRRGNAPVMYNLASSQGIAAGRVMPEPEGYLPGVMIKKADEVSADAPSAAPVPAPVNGPGNGPVQVRRNFNETAFFFPDLRTDSGGNTSFSFTMPEALTSWKWMVLAHTKELAFGYSEKTVVTQKQLMVQPNVPRFLREGDHLDLPVKVVNLTDSEMTGQVALQLTDPTTGETADGWFTNRQPNQYFTVGPGQSAVVSFPLVVPFQYNRPLTYRVTAQSKSYSDGEEAVLPVVSNRMLVTETLPLDMKGDGTRQFTFGKLLHSGGSETLNHHALTVEFTANPVWYAVQSLPYLSEYPYECAEQTFNRWYANALAARIVGSSPRLKEIFRRWETQDTAALLSNLQKNQELKSVLLEETPWVLQGKTEEQQKKNVARLFDMNRMSTELATTFDRLKAMQSEDGGFAWFKGGMNDLYITQYILTGIGHMQRLNAIPESLVQQVAGIVKPALAYVDLQMKKRYEEQVKARPVAAAKTVMPWIGELPVQYLYMRSFFNDYGIPGNILPAVSYFRKQVQGSWVSRSKYVQGMIALALFRTGDVQTAKDIVKSLKQTAIVDAERGMYWKGMEGGYYWYEAPIEIQSLLIEAFGEIGADKAVDRDLKTWLLKQKQTHSWRTTKATADACYALLVGGVSWVSEERNVTIRLGDKLVQQEQGEAGTGYFKKVFDAPFVNPSMGNITVTMGSAGAGSGSGSGSPAWGSVYWQYFDILDKITPPGSSKAPLALTKQLFIERLTGAGRVLEPVADNGVLRPGDKVVVRIQLKADRSLEYVHMKDMRAACMEPVNVISQYKWQDGLGYYESTKDASTDFFFSLLPRGTYVFEYPLTVGQAGSFSNGITSVECMYAPEFSYHSEGIRVSVE